jgi:hypothetical protein
MLSSRTRTFVDLATTIAIVATCGALVWASRSLIWPAGPPSLPVPEAPISTNGAPTKGNPVAPFVMVTRPSLTH